MAKKFYIKESKREAAEKENALYGNNIMLEYETEQEYKDALHKFKEDGFNVY